MTVAKFNQPDASQGNGTQYKADIDASIAVMAELGANFAPHEADTPDMTVVIDAGKLMIDEVLTVVAQQTTTAFVAPVTNPRIDRIALDVRSGNYEVIAGTEAAGPVAPVYKGYHYPVCQIGLSVAQSFIANSNIIDERVLFLPERKKYFISIYADISQILSTSSPTVVDFGNESLDPVDAHDLVTNNSRITVPSNYGFTRARIVSQISFANNASGIRRMRLLKNGNTTFDQRAQEQRSPDATGFTILRLVSDEIPVSDGDYFEISAYQNSGGNLGLFADASGDDTWMTAWLY